MGAGREVRSLRCGFAARKTRDKAGSALWRLGSQDEERVRRLRVAASGGVSSSNLRLSSINYFVSTPIPQIPFELACSSSLRSKKVENTSMESIRAVASRIAVQPLPLSNPDVWGVLTAISDNARKRVQGINMLLSADGHCIGRVVEDARFRIDSTAVSQRHCQILRRRVAVDTAETSCCIYEYILKDSRLSRNWFLYCASMI